MYPAYPGAPAGPSRPPLTKRLRPAHWIAIDCVVGAVAALFMFAVSHQPVHAGPAFGPVQAVTSPHSAFPAGPLLAAVTFFPIALRRRGPVLAYGALIILGTLLIGAAEVRSAVLFLGAAYVLYTVTVTSSKRSGVAALALGVGVMVLVIVITQQAQTALNSGVLVPVAFALVIAWFIGYSVRQRRLYIVTLQHQAASSAVAEERLRIARELHDVVAHSMSVIAVQAGYGQYVIDASPEGAREALDAIQATSRDALDEMRRMLGVLRQQDSGQQVPGQQVPGQPDSAGPGAMPAAAGSVTPNGATSGSATSGSASPDRASPDRATSDRATSDRATSDRATSDRATSDRAGPAVDLRGVMAPAPAPLAPAPGLADLGRLIERTGGAGITVSLEISGAPRPVPASVDLSAYRIIQEALTNVVKHAGGGAACAVVVRYTDAELVIRVTDDGGKDLVLSPAGLAPRGSLATGGGHGIIGMRERAILCGGQFSAGPRGNGGWHVSAMLPLPTPGTREA